MKVLSLTFLSVLCFLNVAVGQSTDITCPVLTVEGPTGPVRDGEPAIFKAKITDLDKNIVPEYLWLVSSGRISAGQGTTEIQVVDTPRGENLTATVEVKGFPANCVNYASETTAPLDAPELTVLADYEAVSWKKEQEILGDAVPYINNNPNASVYIVISFAGNESFSEAQSRSKKIVEYLRFHTNSYEDILRFRIHKEASLHLTKIYLVPAGASTPSCDGECVDYTVPIKN